MKTNMKYASLIAIVLLVILSSCGSDDPSPDEVMTNLLMAHPWKLSSATVDATDQTTLYSGLTLTFTKTDFSTTNGGIVWPASGTWTFKDKTAKFISRNDGLQIEIIEATKSSLKLGFTWTKKTFKPGRIESLSGNHVFTLVE